VTPIFVELTRAYLIFIILYVGGLVWMVAAKKTTHRDAAIGTIGPVVIMIGLFSTRYIHEYGKILILGGVYLLITAMFNNVFRQRVNQYKQLRGISKDDK